MSTINRSLILEEIKESNTDFDDLFSLQYLSISNHSTDEQTAHQVVNVTGNITVSF